MLVADFHEFVACFGGFGMGIAGIGVYPPAIATAGCCIAMYPPVSSTLECLAGVDPAALLETLPLALIVMREDGTMCHANAPARRLALVIHSNVAAGLTRLAAGSPLLERVGAATPIRECEDIRHCDDEHGATLSVLRQWRTCADSNLVSVCIRPAPVKSNLNPDAGAAGCDTMPETAGQPYLGSDQQHMIHADKLATVGQLAAGMAHEINNPICYVQSNLGTFSDYLNKMFGLLELGEELLRDKETGAASALAQFEARKQAIDLAMVMEDLPALLEESREGVERIRQIVENLRNFSRTDAAESMCRFDLHQAINATLQMVRSLGGKVLRFETRFGELPLIECNPTALNQVFMNILVNATQAVGADGVIEIRTGAEKKQVWVEIRDNGHGIESEVLGRIFEPFFTTKEVGRGTGLGLSISYGIIKKHGGDIVAISQPGLGTTFRITLPVRQG